VASVERKEEMGVCRVCGGWAEGGMVDGRGLEKRGRGVRTWGLGRGGVVGGGW